MRPQKGIFIAILLLLVIGAAVCLLVPREPRYQSKSLSEWLRSLDQSPLQFQALAVETNQPAAQALLHMAGEAIPYLVRELRARDSTVKLKLAQLLGKQSFLGIDLAPAYVRQRRAIQACYALGPIAKAAIPELTERLSERRISQTLRTFALAAIGPDALPSIISALTNGDPEVRLYTASALRNVSFNAEAAVPALVGCLSDPQEYRVRCEAALALAHIRKRPELVLPALTHNLSDTNETVRSLTASALARFRAVPP